MSDIDRVQRRVERLRPPKRDISEAVRARIAAYVTETVDKAPPLSKEQLDNLSVLFRQGARR